MICVTPSVSARLAGTLVTLLTLAACAEPVQPAPPGSVEATVRFVDIEGGCWTLKTQERSYLPINLEDKFRVDGLEVYVEFHERDDLGSFCQIGPVVEISSIQER